MKSLATEWFIVLMLAAMFLGNQPWEEKAYTEWTQQDVLKIRTHSPWTRQVEITVGKGSPMDEPDPNSVFGKEYRTGGASDHPNAPKGERKDGAFLPLNVETLTFDIRWASSLTWRQSMVRRAQLAGVPSAMAAAELAQSPPYYMLTVSGGSSVEYSGLAEAMLRESAYLEIEPTKQKIALGPVGVSLQQVDFYFPREANGKPTIDANATKVSFRCKLKVSSIHAEFDLKKMVRQGKRDL